MSRLTPVDGALHDRILDDTYPLWHDGLTRERYGLYNRGQMQTPWGARALTRLALVDRGQVLASAKRYDLTIQVDGCAVPTLGIGAVFTPLEQRRHGHAARLIDTLCAEAKAAGAHMAMLFSEIGPRYYER